MFLVQVFYIWLRITEWLRKLLLFPSPLLCLRGAKTILVKVSKAQMLLTEKSSIPVATPVRNGLAILEEPGGSRAGPLQGGQQEPYYGQSDRM